jgi:hypothetical protein
VVAGYECEVHHAPDWEPDGRTDADALFFGCGPDHKLVTDGHATTTVGDDGRLAWSVGTDPPETNTIHHDDQLLDDEP